MTKLVITPVGVSMLENVLKRRQQLQSLGMPTVREVEQLERRCRRGELTAQQAAGLEDTSAQETAARFERAFTALWESQEQRYTVDGGRRKRKYSPAELASLSLLDLQPDDGITLLYSETARGAFCAAVLERLLSSGVAVHSGLETQTQMIEGLQVEDLGRFTDQGVVNYVDAVDQIVAAQKEGTSVLLNITGGYKGVAPIATIIAMALGVKVCYLYEESDQLLFLPPLQVRFGFSSLFASYRAIMLDLAPATHPLPRALSDQFWEVVVDDDREELEKYVTRLNGEVQLSPLGVLAWKLHTSRPQIGQGRPYGSLELD
jgi:putative CRISPR-associated protein (TIGR02619 family)